MFAEKTETGAAVPAADDGQTGILEKSREVVLLEDVSVSDGCSYYEQMHVTAGWIKLGLLCIAASLTNNVCNLFARKCSRVQKYTKHDHASLKNKYHHDQTWLANGQFKSVQFKSYLFSRFSVYIMLSCIIYSQGNETLIKQEYNRK